MRVAEGPPFVLGDEYYISYAFARANAERRGDMLDVRATDGRVVFQIIEDDPSRQMFLAVVRYEE